MKREIFVTILAMAVLVLFFTSGCQKEKEDNPTVYNNPPVADFIADTTSGIAPFSVHFTDLSTNNPTDYFWLFGDGDSSTQANPSHTYYTPQVYTVSLTVSNASSSHTETKSNFILVGTSICPPTFTDPRDNHVYSAVVIGNQCWMAENLAYLPVVYPSNPSSSTVPYYYVYGYQGTSVSAAKATSNYQTYGVLYNWPAAMDGQASSNSVPSGVQGVCPPGWHLPSDEEWKILEGEVDSQYGYPDPEWNGLGLRGYDAGSNLKEVGTTHWYSPNPGAINSSGFTALPGGHMDNLISFNYLGNLAYFWSAREDGSSYAWLRSLGSSGTIVSRNHYNKHYGYSVRCCKD